MINVTVNEQQKEYAKNLVENYDFGQRGVGDGNSRQQYIGMLAQTVIADLLNHDRPCGETGFDGGIDFIINEKSFDVKTMERSVSMQDHYAHNLMGYQIEYDVDYYLFCSYNNKNNILSICGYISSDDFQRNSEFFPAGSFRERDNNTRFMVEHPLYEIRQGKINKLDNIDDIFNI